MNKKLYQESIILIGPSGAGKSSVAEELHKITGMPRLCLDKIANAARDTGVKRQFQGEDEFNCFMISKVLERTKKNDEYGIVDFGAGHSVYDDILIFLLFELYLYCKHGIVFPKTYSNSIELSLSCFLFSRSDPL